MTKLTTEATFDASRRARHHRAELMADEDIDDPGDRAAALGAAYAAQRRPRKGTWPWWCAAVLPVPGRVLRATRTNGQRDVVTGARPEAVRSYALKRGGTFLRHAQH